MAGKLWSEFGLQSRLRHSSRFVRCLVVCGYGSDLLTGRAVGPGRAFAQHDMSGVLMV